jgi:hypothetical protein
MSEIVVSQRAAPKLRNCTFAAASAFSIHQLFPLPSIPHGLQIPLSPLDPELLQVSDTTASELDLSLYAFPHVIAATRCVY